MELSLAEISTQIATLPPEQQREILMLMEELDSAKKRERCQANFLEFVKAMWPAFIEGAHHKVMADKFEEVVGGKVKRLTISLPPRHSKSELTSYLLPAWFLGKYPNKKVIQISHTAELATGFGRKVRNLVASKEYQEIFPGVSLQADSKAAGRWNTNQGGEYFAIGVGGAVTGKGADLLIIDDPHAEQEAALGDPAVYDRTYEWYTSGPRQRLQPRGSVLIVATRWAKRDLIGRVVRAAAERGGDEWEVLELPAILPSGKSLWPEFWKVEELEAIRAEIPAYKWLAQFQQTPTAEEGAIIKREWWKKWKQKDPPKCEFIIQAWDTAFLKKETADFSACSTWGVWRNDDGKPQIILVDAFKDRWEFPDLKEVAFKAFTKYRPHSCVVEAKASGVPLIAELRRRGLVISEYTPSRGQDKIARLNSVSDLFSSGIVWAPETPWAEQVIEEFAEFPNGDYDDMVDSGVLALMRFRSGGFVQLPSDEKDDPLRRVRRAGYY